jgi:hypothetical protein
MKPDLTFIQYMTPFFFGGRTLPERSHQGAPNDHEQGRGFQNPSNRNAAVANTRPASDWVAHVSAKV